MNSKTILVVDDDVDFLEQTCLVLKKAGYQTITAESQAAAETLLATVKPDLALLDLMMEHYDSGFVLAYHLKKRYPEVPVIIATSVTSETGLHFGTGRDGEREWVKADLILDKGIRSDQLLGAISKLLEG